MSASILKEIDLRSFERLLREAAGVACPMALCGRDGAVVWSSDAADDDHLARVIAELDERGFEWEFTSRGPQRCDLGAEDELFYVPLNDYSGERIGRFVVLLRDAGGRLAADKQVEVARILEAVADCISSETRLASEAESLASELSERHEELNLFYSLEGHSRSFDQGPVGIEALLLNFAESLRVDVAALVELGRRRPLHALHPDFSLNNLDLVLTELRGNLFRFVCSRRAPLAINESDDPRRRYLMMNLPFKLLACPIVVHRHVEAMLVLMRRPEGVDFSNSDRSLGQVVASQTAIMMRNHAMLKKMERFGQQMAAALIEAVEAKDPYTRGHSERVQSISMYLGKGFGMDELGLEGVYWGALLHDIGKIGVPDMILCKAGRLTDDEYTFIKIHPERSYEIMRHIEYLSREALEGARYHQERYDGGGYPHGLKGKDIPLPARVIAVADTYDAITSSRAYRPGQSHEVALAEIRRVAGSQLDPEITVVFERMCSKDVRWLQEITRSREQPDD